MGTYATGEGTLLYRLLLAGGGAVAFAVSHVKEMIKSEVDVQIRKADLDKQADLLKKKESTFKEAEAVAAAAPAHRGEELNSALAEKKTAGGLWWW
ncbi:hypothetical protein E2562_023245 [Oryza meyeriana var. granulata]|uniref:Uncharacterized protein n=1 Tax=Oryza meyeriana var. granulata TaxID=110450 RepID=A0A6G1DLI4_9ORYZ|nr:hypothetical protein E2562_023245 [Oryza meyeriana var. granulata]